MKEKHFISSNYTCFIETILKTLIGYVSDKTLLVKNIYRSQVEVFCNPLTRKLRIHANPNNIQYHNKKHFVSSPTLIKFL